MPYPGESVAAGVSFNQVLLIDNLIITMGEEPPLPNTTKTNASRPYPPNASDEISKDVGILWWKAGEFVEAQNGTHNVFFGTNFDDVNDATASDPLGTTAYQDLALDANSITLDRLEYDTTYYWRVDEVNAPENPFFR